MLNRYNFLFYAIYIRVILYTNEKYIKGRYWLSGMTERPNFSLTLLLSLSIYIFLSLSRTRYICVHLHTSYFCRWLTIGVFRYANGICNKWDMVLRYFFHFCEWNMLLYDSSVSIEFRKYDYLSKYCT